ncbi:MAG: macro domain-containing protein [Oscillospiraceae bacterium]|nr:macro domain-containing protein [Oscillospiraceae bacterium]
MAAETITGDLMQQNTEAIVIPVVPFSGPSSKFTRTVYEAAGYDELLEARRAFGHLHDGEAAVTSGFGLRQKHVIHVYTPEWFGGISGEPKYLTRCYCNALKAAVRQGIRSVAFPLLGTGTNRVPLQIALRIAEDALRGYIRAHSLDIRAVLVIHPATAKALPELHADSFAAFAEMSSIQESAAYERFHAYLRRIECPSRFAESIGCSPSTITRILNRKGKSVPHKITVLLIALGLGLTREERLDFMNSVYAPYPHDARDRRLEELLEEGHTNITLINSLLAEDDPDWILMHKPKGEQM